MTAPTVFDSATPRFSLPLLFAGQAQKEFFVNEAHALIDVLLHSSIEGTASNPPTDPIEGECWLVGVAATGVWSGHEGSLAFCNGGTWRYLAPTDGMKVFDRSARQVRMFDGVWRAAAAPIAPTGGATVDFEARQAIEGLISALRSHGLLPAD